MVDPVPESSSNPERLWTVDEFAGLWDRTPKTVRRWIREGRIRVVRLGGAVRIPDAEVRRLTSPPDEDDEAPAGDELIPNSARVSRMLTGARSH